VIDQYSLLEFSEFSLSVTECLYLKMIRKGVYRLGTDPVKPHRFLEGAAVVLGTGIDFGNNIHHFAERDPAAVIAYRHAAVVDRNVNNLPVTHHMLVDAVIDNLFHEDVNTVVFRRAIAELSDIHTGAEPDVLTPVQRLDTRFVILSHCR